MIGEDLKEISLEYLMNSSLGSEIQSTFDTYEKVQETLYSLATLDDETILFKLKVGTVLTFNVINRVANGVLPANFTKDDWREIANSVADDAVNIDPEKYSSYVFQTYADYIEVSAAVVSAKVSEDSVNKIKALAIELRDKTEMLEEEQISEGVYIEDCLWISLEAIIKLLAATIGSHLGAEVGRFIEGVSTYSFEYGRLALYKQEQEVLTSYIEQQYELDAELQEKYDTYIHELQIQSNRFEELVKGAFDSNFRNSLKGSVELALEAGVKDGIVESVDDVDRFFLD